MRRLSAIAREPSARWTAAEWRRAAVMADLFQPGRASCVYWETDRTVVGGIVPLAEDCGLPAPASLRAAHFLERREAGIINIGEPGFVTADGRRHRLEALDGLYLGRGAREVSFASAHPERPAQFYLLSYPAHTAHPTAFLPHAEAARTELGTPAKANCRLLCKYIHPEGPPSCQLVMGLTLLREGSLWNTMPPHTHSRRSEVYLYFGLARSEAVFHFAGAPEETRSLVLRDREAVVSPPWSIHCGAGTARYSFVWGMGGENQEFSDIDPVDLALLG